MYCLDANLWISYLDADLEEHDEVESAVRDALEGEALFTTTVLQMEVVHYVVNNLAESESILADFLSMQGVTVADLRPGDVERAVSILEEHPNAGLGGRDASVLAAIERHPVTELWTHDEAFANVTRDVDGLRVRAPVEESVCALQAASSGHARPPQTVEAVNFRERSVTPAPAGSARAASPAATEPSRC